MNKKIIIIDGSINLKLYLDLPEPDKLLSVIKNEDYKITSSNISDARLELYKDYRSKMYFLDVNDELYSNEDTHGLLVITNERTQGLLQGMMISYSSDDDFTSSMYQCITSLSNINQELIYGLNKIDENNISDTYWRQFMMNYMTDVLNYKFVDFKI